MKGNLSKNIFYAVLVLSFATGVFFKQFGIFTYQPFLLVSFCGTIGLLLDYAWRIRKSWWALVPFLTGLEFFGDLASAAGLRESAFWVYLVSASLFPVYGYLFMWKGAQLWKEDRPVSWKFIVLGVLSTSLVAWEIATYFPHQIENTHIGFRVMYLSVFAWLLFIDYTVDFSNRPQLEIEKQILRVSLLIMATFYFVRFVFK